MPFLNYHHLRYFRLIARELSVSRGAKKLNLSAPALSIQLKQLEQSLGHTLLERRRGGLVLTEAGRLALDYAETIGRAGEEGTLNEKVLTTTLHGCEFHHAAHATERGTTAEVGEDGLSLIIGMMGHEDDFGMMSLL